MVDFVTSIHATYVENLPNLAGLWKTQLLMKMQMENTLRHKMRSSTRWLSRFFKILGF